MMAGYQQVIIIGNVGRDPEIRYTRDGVAVCNFSVAVSRRWTQNGEQREETTWFRVSAWRSLAETCQQYVHKGMQIMVVGRIDVSAYSDQHAHPRASLELTALDVQFLGRKGDAAETPQTEEAAGGDFPF
ncbi:single-stranded DNA-binding protein [Candidatus Uhrbacteria bacterium]|nr:single-stranded DNA-binding protein [Candidatus Uhrbacteria bacterium]